jgi:poly(hydroxyalkanoate) granule-associated protein
MTDKPNETEKKEKKHFYEASRKVLLASIGAVALAQDEMEDFVDRLVERGELAEQEGKKLVQEMMDKRKKQMKGGDEGPNKRVQEMLDRLNVPTKADLEALTGKIAELTKKIDELTKPQS